MDYTYKKNARILVVDDEPGMRELLEAELHHLGYRVTTARDGTEALSLIGQEEFHLVITDVRMPNMDGIVMLGRIKEIDPNLEVIMMSGHGSVETAVEAMKKGAYDFILKPFSLDEIKMLVEKALEKKELKGLVALYESTKAIFSTVRLNDLCEIVIATVVKTFKADVGSVILLNESRRLVIAASRGIPQELTKETQLEIGERIAGLAAHTKQEFLLTGGISKYPAFENLPGNPRILSSIVCPLVSPEGGLLGILNLSRTRNPENFTTTDLQGASIFASLASLGIVNAKLFNALEAKISELRDARDRLFQQEKLASIGRLVAGVAHELNNPLTSVIGYSQLASASDNMADIKRSLPIIYEQALRCSKIVKDLLIFARQKKTVRQPLRAASLMEESIGGLSLEFQKRKIRVDWRRPDEEVFISADQTQLKQVFTNLLTNAFQALEHFPGEKKISVSIQTAADKVRFIIKDNGPGVSDEVAPKIFDPFFTTKDVGQGTGLGLSLSYGIIKEHGGVLYFEKNQPQGACFIVELPYQKTAEVVPEKPVETVVLGGNGLTKVLLIEDEAPIRDLIQNILGPHRYRFDMAEDGRTALDKINANEYDLILCDYRIPLMDGITLYFEVKKNRPDKAKRFLFVSGSTEFVQNPQKFFSGQQVSCLLKPFTKDELIEAVGKIQVSLEKLERPA